MVNKKQRIIYNKFQIKNINQRDWDREENRNLYFQKSNLKRPNEDDNEATNKNSLSNNTKKLYIPPPNYNKHNNLISSNFKQPYIELAVDEDINWADSFSPVSTSNTNHNKLWFNLVGHNSTVNRINWARRNSHKSLLLSCSMDGYYNKQRIYKIF